MRIRVFVLITGIFAAIFGIYALSILKHYSPGEHLGTPRHIDSDTATPGTAMRRIKIESSLDRKDLSKDHYTHVTLISGGNSMDCEIEIRGRLAGDKSGKNSYKIKPKEALIDGDNDNRRYTLRSAKGDPTMLRDWFAQKLWQLIYPGKGDTMHYEFVVFEYNDEDLGVYLLITSPKDRIIDEKFTDQDDFCFLEIDDRNSVSVSWLPAPYFDIKDPDIEELDQEKRETIAGIVKRFHDQDITVVDLDSWAAEFVFAEFARDINMHDSSFYMYTADGKVHFGPQWDFDASFACPGAGPSFNRPEGFSLRVSSNLYFQYDGIISDPSAADRVVQTWQTFSATTTAENLVELIDLQYKEIEAELKSSYDRWGGYKMVRNRGLFAPKTDQFDAGGHPLIEPLDTLEEQVDRLKTFVRKRYAWLDEHIEEVRDPELATRTTIKNWGVFFIVFVLLATLASTSCLVLLAAIIVQQYRKLNTKSNLTETFF